MKPRRSSILLFIAVSCTCAISSAQEDPATIGQKFGNIITGAITAVTPALGPFIQMIRDTIATNRSGVARDEQVVKVADLEVKLREQQAKLTADFRSSLNGLSGIATEIDVVLDFVQPSLDANAQVIPIAHLLATNTSLSDANNPAWNGVVDQWTRNAKPALTRLGSIPANDIANISSIYLRTRLAEIRSINVTLTGELDRALEQHDRQSALVKVDALSQKLNGLVGAAGFLMNDLSKGFARAAGAIPMGAIQDERETAFRRALDNAAQRPQ